MLKEGRNVSDADAVYEALEFRVENAPKSKEKNVDLLECAGIIKLKSKSKANYSVIHDKILYGDMDAND